MRDVPCCVYRDRQYSTRLEARWAAFFDLIGWRHAYVPLRLSGRGRVFVLSGVEQQVIAQVLPITLFRASVAAKVLRAVEKAPKFLDVDLLLLGEAPVKGGTWDHSDRVGMGAPEDYDSATLLGWLCERNAVGHARNQWGEAIAGWAGPWNGLPPRPTVFDFAHQRCSYVGRMTGLCLRWADGKPLRPPAGGHKELHNFWMEAGDAVK